MRSFLSMAAFISLVGSAAAANLTDAEVKSVNKEVVGAWKLEFTTPDDVARTPIVLVGRQHQELVAWYVEKEKPEAISKVRLNDDTLTMSLRPKERDDVTVTIEAKLKEEGVCVGTGTYTLDDGESGSWDIQGKRLSPSDFDQTEQWQLSFVTPDDQEREAVVTVISENDKLYGWYSSKEYELPATKISKNGNEVVMSLKLKTSEGRSVDVTFRGSVDGDRVTGKVEYDLEGETGDFPFQGRRKS